MTDIGNRSTIQDLMRLYRFHIQFELRKLHNDLSNDAGSHVLVLRRHLVGDMFIASTTVCKTERKLRGVFGLPRCIKYFGIFGLSP